MTESHPVPRRGPSLPATATHWKTVGNGFRSVSWSGCASQWSSSLPITSKHPLPPTAKGPSLFRLNLSPTCPASYLQLGTIKEEIKTEGCQRRKLRRPFPLSRPQTHHKTPRPAHQNLHRPPRLVLPPPPNPPLNRTK